MLSDDDAAKGVGIRSEDEAEIRSKAVKRSWFCPGAGFALAGYGKCAIATFVASVGFLPAVGWVAFRPAAASLGTVIAVIVISTVL